MTTPPPPAGPPAGWYPDPDGAEGYRWWDGTTWSDATRQDLQGQVGPTGRAAGSGEPPTSSQDGQPGAEAWLGETLRVARSQGGNYLALIVVFVVPLAMASALCIFYGLRDTTLTFPEVGSEPAESVSGPEIVYGGSSAALLAGFLLLALSQVPATVLRAAVARCVVAGHQERSQTWAESVRGVLSLRLLTAAALRSALTLAPWLLLAAAVLWSPSLVLLVPVGLLVVALLWARLSFVDVVAGVAPADKSTLGTSLRVSGRGTAGVFGRLLALLVVRFGAVTVLSLVGSLVISAAGLASEPVPFGATSVDFNAVLGPNLATHLLSNLFFGLGIGVGWVISGVGLTLLYRDRGGLFATVGETQDDRDGNPTV